MAQRARSLAANVEGELFVDATCIDCDTCRWMAPATFGRAEGQSYVHTQPEAPEERVLAHRALVACPTGSIGAASKPEILAARAAFPVPIDADVLHCGWHSEKSFGAASYLLRRAPEAGGNVLIDSPRFSEPLARRLESLGGVRTMFLTHRDDVADHQRFAERFGCRRVLHRDDLRPGTSGVELLLEGEDPVQLDADLLAIPTPGHTEGSTCLLASGRHLFSGDHIAWSVRLGHLYGFRSACWFDWERLTASTERLREHAFEWVLPGHGRRAHLEARRMAVELERAVAWMRTV